MVRTWLAAATSVALSTCPPVASALAHSVPVDPAAPRMPVEDYPPSAGTPQVLTTIPNAPPQVESVVNRFKIWRTGTTLPGCFLNGGPDLRAFFVSTARTWLDQGGLAINFGDAPSCRDCRGPEDRAIRLAFGYRQGVEAWDTGNWSYVGTDANTAPAGPIVNIGYAANTSLSQLDDRELRRLVLHEVGHALRFEHEHQSPLALCKFDWAKVVPYYQSHYAWDEAKTRFNLGAFAPTPGLQATPFDPDSIMNYGFPAWMFVQTGSQICEIRVNYEPSYTDLHSYAALYPGKTRAQASTTASTEDQQAQKRQAEQERLDAQRQQERTLAERAARTVSELEQLLPDEGQRRQAGEFIDRITRQQFPDFKLDLQNNRVSVGAITQRTDRECSPAVAGAGGNVSIDSSCTTNNSTIGTQNNVQGNQFNNSGTINNQGGINFGAPSVSQHTSGDNSPAIIGNGNIVGRAPPQ